MNDLRKPILYYSHSWLPEDVDINLAVWREISSHCQLLVDDNQGAAPPYYVSRIEDSVRRSDGFLAVLLAHPPGTGASPTQPAGALNGASVSPYTLFEVSLAERAAKPSLILYEAGAKSVPEAMENAGVQHLMFERKWLFDARHQVLRELTAWLQSIDCQPESRAARPNDRAAILVASGESERSAARKALRAAGMAEIVDLTKCATDVEIQRALRSCRLLVADVGSPTLWSAYGMAHGMFIPTIRTIRSNGLHDLDRLPPILRGHAAGYQDDLVCWASLPELEAAIAQRAAAIRIAASVINGHEDGAACFERRRRDETT